MSQPIAVLIADLHFNLSNLDVASKILAEAIDMANEFNVKLIIAGDLHDTKAIIRAEVANRLLIELKRANVKPIILIGNHDLINEKGSEHALSFLDNCAKIIDSPCIEDNIAYIPYQHTTETFESFAKTLPEGIILVCHQGFKGAITGECGVRPNEVDPVVLKRQIVFSGHFHNAQTVGENIHYIGSPYTITFGEANDPSKSFMVLYKDGSYIREETGARKHIIIKATYVDNWKALRELPEIGKNDLVWVKLFGPLSAISAIKRDDLIMNNFNGKSIKLSLHSTGGGSTIECIATKELSEHDLFDKIIDDSGETEDQKKTLKYYWRKIL